jgi:Mce-associated membrane protein
MAEDAAAPDGELNETTAAEPESKAIEASDDAADEAAKDSEASEATEDSEDSADEGDEPPAKAGTSHVKLALIAGLVLVLALGGLTGWLGFRAYQSHKADELRKLYLQVGRQGALNLTTIDFGRADADVQRILDSATGTFYDDFQARAQPFVEVVKQAQSKSVGTVAEAGLVSESENQAQVLVAVTVETSNAGAPEQAPRAWRMRITVEKVGDEVKVAKVDFVA